MRIPEELRFDHAQVLLVGSRLPESLYHAFFKAYHQTLPTTDYPDRLTPEVRGAEEVTFRALNGAYVRFGLREET